MSKKIPTIWSAKPHTLAKIKILKGYLDAWVPILGSKFQQPLIYVDGFAGPGRYTGGEDGSPIAAVRAASSGIKRIEKSGNRFVSKEMHFFFVEKDPKRCGHLEQTLSVMNSCHERLRIHRPILSTFAEALPKIAKKIPDAFEANAPVLLFADPFGATGMPFKILKDAVRGSSSELLINLDADGVRRIYQAPNNRREEQLSELFGCDLWQDFEACANDHQKLHREILALYKRQILTIPGMKYIWQFGMRGIHNTLNYYLVFASKNPLGLEKMKEAMRRISQDGSYTFSDASVGQEHMMFEQDDIAVFGDRLWKKFSGRTVEYRETVDYALNETPFTNPKPMLSALEKQGRLHLDGQPNRKIGTFPDGMINSLEFIVSTPERPKREQLKFRLNEDEI